MLHKRSNKGFSLPLQPNYFNFISSLLSCSLCQRLQQRLDKGRSLVSLPPCLWGCCCWACICCRCGLHVCWPHLHGDPRGVAYTTGHSSMLRPFGLRAVLLPTTRHLHQSCSLGKREAEVELSTSIRWAASAAREARYECDLNEAGFHDTVEVRSLLDSTSMMCFPTTTSSRDCDVRPPLPCCSHWSSSGGGFEPFENFLKVPRRKLHSE